MLLKDIAYIFDGTHQTPNYTKSGIPFISVENISNIYDFNKYISEDAFNNEFSKNHPEIDDILMTRIGDIGTPAFVTKNINMGYYVSLALIKVKKCISKYLYYFIQTNYFQKELWRKTIHVAFPKKINKEDIGECKILLPEIKEQKRIVQVLDLIEKRIETQNKIIEDFEVLIKGIRYIIFSKLTNCYNKTKLQKLGSFLTEYSMKNINNNLQSASIGKYGIRMRNEIYSKDLTSDYSKNKVIFKDTLSIGMGSSQIDIGILSEDEKYCISPAYTTYKIDNINSKYLNEYLIYLNPLLSKRYMIIGARQGKSVNKSELLEHELSIHSMQEQYEIVKMFSSLFAKLQKEKDILLLYKKQKAYLLQNMFI